MKCMQTNFGGCSLSGFGDIATFLLPSKMAKFSFQTIKSAQRNHANRGCEMHPCTDKF